MTETAIQGLNRRQIAWRVAQDLRDGDIVNLGIGVPTLVADYIGTEREVILQSENGILGLGPAPAEAEADPELINATKHPVSLLPGGCYFDHCLSFAMIRGGHLDVAVMGALEVAENGDLANWRTDEPSYAPGVGGAMDLAVGTKRIWVAMQHRTRDGRPRLRRRCSYPLTAPGVVQRVYSDLAVMAVEGGRLVVLEAVPGLGPEDFARWTEAAFVFADDCRALTAPVL